MSGYLRFFLVLIFSSCMHLSSAEKESTHKTICLNMIVKNEKDVIKRCLSSVKPILDYWVIVDTGSTDGTQEIIKNFMSDIPGELHERPWKNFGHNRTEALELAKEKADYVFIIDADEVLKIDSDFTMPVLDKDLYYIMTEYGGLRYARTELINNKLNWKWIGVLHEYLDSPDIKSRDVINGLTNVVNTDGARSKDPLKYQKDAIVLEEALKEDPTNSRNVFYLAQSYRDADDYENAIKWYKKRTEMGGWDQEVYWSKYQIGQIKEYLDKPFEEILQDYLAAYNYRPTRVEPLYKIADYLRKKGNAIGAYIMASTGLALPISNDVLFVERWMYDWGLLIEFTLASYSIGRYPETIVCCQKLLENKSTPKEIQELANTTLKNAQAKQKEIEDLRKANEQENKKEEISAEESLAK